MNFRNTTISVFLLLSYTFGFAHSLTPHCLDQFEADHTSSKTGVHHLHEHHQHANEHGVDHSHIAHQNHLDDGIFDLVLCVLNEHHATDDSHQHYLPAQYNASANSKTNLVATLITSLTENDEKEKHIAFGSEVSIRYLSPPSLGSPQRGPPFFPVKAA